MKVSHYYLLHPEADAFYEVIVKEIIQILYPLRNIVAFVLCNQRIVKKASS